MTTGGWPREEMIQRVIEFFHPGASVNLGIGLPTMVAELAPPELDLFVHSENGVLGVGDRPRPHEVSPTLINAGKETITVRAGASYFDSSMSFGMIRGGHIDFCVLGGFEVDAAGSLANWMIPGQKVTGMGGAMDLVNGSRHVIVVMTHFNKSGEAKLVERCRLPLTGLEVVHTVVTDLGVFHPGGGRFQVRSLAPGVSNEDLRIPLHLLA